MNITLIDERTSKEKNFCYDGGIVSFVEKLNTNKEVLHEPPILLANEKDGITVEIAMQYSTSYSETIYTFVNSINTIEGGTHLSGFKAALTRSLNDYARQNTLIKNGSISGDDTAKGSHCVIKVQIPLPSSRARQRRSSATARVKGIVESLVTQSLGEFLEEHPRSPERLLKRPFVASQAREAARKARELTRRKNGARVDVPAGETGGLLGKGHRALGTLHRRRDSAGGSASRAGTAIPRPCSRSEERSSMWKRQRLDKIFR